MAASFRFAGKRILVTGAGKGLGRELTTTLHRCGATVVALSRTKADLDTLKAELPGLVTVPCDISNWDTTREAINKVLPIHHLVNNAGIVGTRQPFVELTEQNLTDVFSVNFNAIVNISQVVSKDMIARKEGLGRGLATTLHRCGATVVALSRTQSDLDSLKAELPGLITVHCDVSDWEATKQAVNKVLPIHHLVNNVGIAGPNKPFTEITEQDLKDVFSVNFNAIVNISQVVVKDMIARNEGGSIVNVSSVVSKVRAVNHAPYCCTKSAINMLTKSMGFELAPHNIRVNAIQPTFFLTQMTRKVLTEDKVFADNLLKRHPTGRLPEISHVVDAILFLLSDLSTMMIGSEVLVDAGYFTN